MPKFPLRSTIQIGKYVAQQRRKGELYPLVLMLEPTLACNIACIGCGKIREYESNKAKLSVDECIDSGVQCPAPVVSICGGEPLVFKGIEDVVAGFLELGKTIDLCTNALRMEEFLDVFEPDHRLTFVVHLDGMQEIHDYICDYPGLWDIAVDAIKRGREAGFRVTTNTTIFKETSVDDVIEMMAFLTNEIGIDGMLIAPGYQYSQIDPALTMTRAEHEEKFRAVRAAVKRARVPLAGEPHLPGLPHRGAAASVRPVGLDYAQPVRLEGPVLPIDGRHLPELRGAARGHRVGALRPRQRPALRALRHSLRFRAFGGVRGDGQPQGDRAEHGVDADRMTMACATTAELRAARRAGLRAELVGLGAKNGIPADSVVSFGLAGGLGDLPSGTVIDATRVVDEEGQVLWEGDPLGVPGARTGTLLGSERVIDDPAERREVHRRTGADAVDLESGVLAVSGQLAGCLRAISDTPQRTLHGLCNAVHEDGRYAWGGLVKAFARAPIGFSRAGADGKRALDALTRAGERWTA